VIARGKIVNGVDETTTKSLQFSNHGNRLQDEWAQPWPAWMQRRMIGPP
jgi:hypothetical protein